MTLQQIEHRLHLFPEWLKYYLTEKYQDPIQYSPAYVMRLHKETGWLFIDASKNALLTFNQWLHENGHEDLVVYEPYNFNKLFKIQ